MLHPVSGSGMNSTMDDINLINGHHLVVRELGEEIDLEISTVDDNASVGGVTLLGVSSCESSVEEQDETKQMAMMATIHCEDQDLSKGQPMKKKKKVVKTWREEWGDTYKWAYVDE